MRRGLAFLVALIAAGLSLARGPSVPDPVLAPPEHRRTPDQTFLTFPEWFLVHSPAEYAAFLAKAERPSEFPLFAHIGQFWQSYAAVSREIGKYPFNGGYHLMVMVIGSSTTVEYGLKGLYEHSIGRIAEASKSTLQVPEERFAAQYAQAYVDFIRVEPWYKFDFWSHLRALWSEPLPLQGADRLRRWERRYLLSTELLVKEGYARLIKLGTQTIYDAPKPTTAVLVSRMPALDVSAHPDFSLLGPGPGTGEVLALIPRYEGFTNYSQWLAVQGIDFIEVAGNRGEILLSVLAPKDWARPRGRLVFAQPILTRPGGQRFVLAVPVADLGALLREVMLRKDQLSIEHVYDF